jgi:hypothetical protein
MVLDSVVDRSSARASVSTNKRKKSSGPWVESQSKRRQTTHPSEKPKRKKNPLVQSAIYASEMFSTNRIVSHVINVVIKGKRSVICPNVRH